MNESILDCISNAVDSEGFLPDTFSLPTKDTMKGARFADGALDGILIYHSSFPVIEDSDKAEILAILRLANNGEHDKAKEALAQFCKKHRAVELIDDIQDVILDHKDELEVDQMAQFAIGLITDSTDKEVIKSGLIILELLDTSGDEDLMRSIRTLGLSDEFTIFAVFIMRHWPDGQMEILDLAKRVHGWGRIHCVHFIEPENPEIRHWLLTDGIDNTVMPEYSALTVFNKAGIAEMLERDDLSSEEKKSILKVIDHMIVEGPVEGISAVEDPPAVLGKVLKMASGLVTDEEDDRVIEEIRKLYETYQKDSGKVL